MTTERTVTAPPTISPGIAAGCGKSQNKSAVLTDIYLKIVERSGGELRSSMVSRQRSMSIPGWWGWVSRVPSLPCAEVLWCQTNMCLLLHIVVLGSFISSSSPRL